MNSTTVFQPEKYGQHKDNSAFVVRIVLVAKSMEPNLSHIPTFLIRIFYFLAQDVITIMERRKAIQVNFMFIHKVYNFALDTAWT